MYDILYFSLWLCYICHVSKCNALGQGLNLTYIQGVITGDVDKYKT